MRTLGVFDAMYMGAGMWRGDTRVRGRADARAARGRAAPRMSTLARTLVACARRRARATVRKTTRRGATREATRRRDATTTTTATAGTSMATATNAPWTIDRYGGIIVDNAHDAFVRAARTPEAFDATLGGWLATWRASGARGVWLKLALDDARLVPVAKERGFEFHHAERTYVMMTTWLPSDEASTIPNNASHQVGVGAFVYDGENEKVLLVQERRGPASGRDLWKMPTGLLEAGEDIPDAAVREVLEETGIETTFDAVVGCRHGHFGLFGKSDLFFCVGLRVKDGASREIKIQETEIERAKWASVDEFLNNPNIEPGSHAHALHERCVRWSVGDYAGIVGKKLPLGFGRSGDVYTYVTTET